MSPIFSINSNKKYSLNNINSCENSEHKNISSSRNIKKRDINLSNQNSLLQKNPKSENTTPSLDVFTQELDNNAIYNIKNPITNVTYPLIDPNDATPCPNDLGVKDKKTFGETVPFEQFSEDLQEGSYGKACASLGLDLLGLLPSVGPTFRGSLEKISSFVKSKVLNENNDDSLDTTGFNRNDLSSNAIAGTYSYIGLPGSAFSLPANFNRYNMAEEKPVTFAKKNVYENVNHAVSSTYNADQASWKLFKELGVAEKTNNFGKALQHSYYQLSGSKSLNKNFLYSLLNKDIKINGNKIPCKDSALEMIQNIKKIIPDHRLLQLLSTYSHPGVLKVAEEQLLKEHPEINNRLSQNMNISYHIDQVDNETFRVSIVKHAYLRPSMFHSPNDIHAYGLRANMLISKTSYPKLQYTYFAQ